MIKSKQKKGYSTKKISMVEVTKQLNLKISTKLMDEVDLYSEEFGYTNAQELIREAIRDKIYGSDNVRTDYLDKLLHNKEFNTSIGEENSKLELEQLKQRINDDS